MSKALCNIQSSLVFPSHKPFVLNHRHHPLLNWHTNDYEQHLSRSCVSISACSAKKPRSRKVKSNVELYNDIIQFVTAIGFPEGYVPSLKDFSENGRSDLANLVRRRGYKLVKELIAKPVETWKKESDSEQFIDVKHYVMRNPEDNSTGQGDTVTDNSWPRKVLDAISEDRSNLGSDENTPFEYDSEWLENYSKNSKVNQVLSSDSDNWNSESEEEKALNNLEGSGANGAVEDVILSNSSSENLSLDEKVARFIQTGDFGTAEDFLHSEEPEQAIGLGNSTVTLNGSMLTEEKHGGADFEDSNVEGRAMEIKRLTDMLREKELLLSRLKEEIDKQEFLLSELEGKAELEIQKGKKLLSEKSAELFAVGKRLSGLGLEEIMVQYCGEGETVDVTGSFNGWLYFIKLDPNPSTSSVDGLISSRKSKVWSTVLLLYPGKYEIKFVVDGEWKINPSMDTVSHGNIINNILRVGVE